MTQPWDNNMYYNNCVNKSCDNCSDCNECLAALTTAIGDMTNGFLKEYARNPELGPRLTGFYVNAIAMAASINNIDLNCNQSLYKKNIKTLLNEFPIPQVPVTFIPLPGSQEAPIL